MPPVPHLERAEGPAPCGHRPRQIRVWVIDDQVQLRSGYPGGSVGVGDRIPEKPSYPDRLWWVQCRRRLAPGPVDRALGLLKEARQAKAVRNPGGFLTTILKRVAMEMEISLT